MAMVLVLIAAAAACVASFDSHAIVGEWDERTTDGGLSSTQFVVGENGAMNYGPTPVTISVDALNHFSIETDAGALCSSCAVESEQGRRAIRCDLVKGTGFTITPATCAFVCIGGACSSSTP